MSSDGLVMVSLVSADAADAAGRCVYSSGKTKTATEGPTLFLPKHLMLRHVVVKLNWCSFVVNLKTVGITHVCMRVLRTVFKFTTKIHQLSLTIAPVLQNS